LPCQTSQPQCLNQLNPAAIAHNLELKTIDQRLTATQTRIDQQRRGKWKTWVQPNPIGIVANILGGGDAQRVEQAIGELELNLGELHRRRAAVETQTREQVLGLVLEIERLERSIAGMKSAQAANAQRLAVIEVGYKFGQGSTVAMMALWEQAEAEKGRIREAENERSQAMSKLAGLTGYGDEMDSGDRAGGIGGVTLSDAQTPGPAVRR
jgi:hypothetical protein